VEVHPGVLWSRMPLPFALDHINLWLLADGEGWVAVDTGIADEGTKSLWDEVLAKCTGGRPLNRLISTHFHPDHFGLAGWLVERTGAPLLMTQTEWLTAALHHHDVLAREAGAQAAFFARHGLTGPHLEALASRGNRYRSLTSEPPEGFTRISDGEELEIGGRVWRVIVGTGHAPEHACLYCRELSLLIAGDQVLPKITPNVTLHASQPEANPLADFLDSLERLARLPVDTLVLPSHGLPFRGLHDRLGQMRDHHHRRLERVLAACETPRSAADLLTVLFNRELDTHQVMFAMGESLAHLAWLVHQGGLHSTQGPGGIVTFGRETL